jgi:hypothetical protein
MSRLAAIVACILTMGVVAVVPAAVAAPISKSTRFHTRNGKVTCGIMIHAPSRPASRILCDAAGVPPPRHGGIGDPGFVSINLLGRPQLLRLSQNSFIPGRNATLGRGRLWNQLGVTCHVGATTVLCFNGANHGFIIGNGKYRSF